MRKCIVRRASQTAVKKIVTKDLDALSDKWDKVNEIKKSLQVFIVKLNFINCQSSSSNKITFV